MLTNTYVRQIHKLFLNQISKYCYMIYSYSRTVHYSN